MTTVNTTYLELTLIWINNNQNYLKMLNVGRISGINGCPQWENLLF